MTDRPGFFRRLFGRGRAPAALAEPPRAEPVHLGPEEETWLSQLVADVGEGRRLDQLASPEVFAQVDALWKSGHERLALEWLRKLIAIPDAPAANEILVAVAVTDSGRPLPRVGGLTAAEVRVPLVIV